MALRSSSFSSLLVTFFRQGYACCIAFIEFNIVLMNECFSDGYL